MLPFASEETLQRLEQNITNNPSVTDMLHEGATVKDITNKILDGLGTADAGFSLIPRWAGYHALFLGQIQYLIERQFQSLICSRLARLICVERRRFLR